MLTTLLIWMCLVCNAVYDTDSEIKKIRTSFLKSVHIASPALATAGRNIAFESGNAIANAPASYLTMLDCCESDEAIASRIAAGKTSCRIIKKQNRKIELSWEQK
ncbi:MAG: hypothetical protein GY874_16550 [Desulfobacteraceae bacterium]|nr:hypothetical protein [Desulfobacteraceae bacterium]